MAVANTLTQNNQSQNRNLGMTAYLTQDAVKNQINQVIGSKNGSRFISSIVSAVQTNQALRECSNTSILSAALLGESLNLSPSPQLGQFYMVPYFDSKKQEKQAQFQLGYKGYIQLAMRSGQYKKINVVDIKDGELIRFDPLNEDIEVNMIEDWEVREKTRTIGYYAMFEYINGFRKAIYWSKERMVLHADKYSKAFSTKSYTKTISKKTHTIVSFSDYEAGNYDKSDEWLYSSFWYKDFDGMAYKTMLRQLISKWGVMSIDMQTAYEKDMTVLKEDGSIEYVDNQTEDNAVVVNESGTDEDTKEEVNIHQEIKNKETPSFFQ